MQQTQLQHIHVHLSGQDDNLGDSVLRDGLLRALKGRGRLVHVYVGAQSSDYLAGLTLDDAAMLHDNRAEWLASGAPGQRPVHIYNAGEINPPGGLYPNPVRSAELGAVRRERGIVVVAGIGIKNPSALSGVEFDAALREADIMSWRDDASRDAAGFGEVNPDWAFALGTPTSAWLEREKRPLLGVTLRFDRPYPDEVWIGAVREIARNTGTRVVTLAQVGRDAPRAVRLAEELGGEYWPAPSFSHAALDAHVRSVFGQSLAVVSDRAHGLIIGASEGAWPIGSAFDAQKIGRLLSTVGLGDLVGQYDELPAFGERLEDSYPALVPAVDTARQRLDQLTLRIHALLGSVAP